MKNNTHLAIGFLAMVLSFTLGYSLGTAQTDTGKLQGNFDAVQEITEEEVAQEEAVAEGEMDVLDISSTWNSETHGLEVTFEVLNAGETAAIGDYEVNAHLRIQDGDRRINFIESVTGQDTRSVKTGESVFIKAYMPGDESLTTLVETGGYEVKTLEVEL